MELFLLFVVIITLIAALPIVLSKPMPSLVETDLQIISLGTQAELPLNQSHTFTHWEEIQEEQSVPVLLLKDYHVPPKQEVA